MMTTKNQSAISRQESARALKTVSRTAHAGFIRRQRAMGSDGVVGNFARWIGIAFVLLALLQGTALAGALNHQEQGLARLLVGDSGQNRNRGEMQLDPILTAVAQARAQDLATRRYFSHVNPDGLGPNCLARAAGYVLPAFWGENRSGNFIESIGGGYDTPEDAWAGWMKSSGHRSHLLASKSFYRDQTRYGVGYHFDRASPFRNYWVVITAPPSSRGEDAFVSRRSAKPARIAGLMPVFSGVDPDEGRIIVCETTSRPSATRPDAAEKLWNLEGSVSAPRPRVTLKFGAG